MSSVSIAVARKIKQEHAAAWGYLSRPIRLALINEAVLVVALNQDDSTLSSMTGQDLAERMAIWQAEVVTLVTSTLGI